MLQQKPLKGRFSPLKDFGSIPFSLQNVSSTLQDYQNNIPTSNFTKRTIWFAEGGAIPLACKAIPVRGKLAEPFLCKSPSANHFHFQGQKGQPCLLRVEGNRFSFSGAIFSLISQTQKGQPCLLRVGPFPGGYSHCGLTGGSSQFEGLTNWLPNGFFVNHILPIRGILRFEAIYYVSTRYAPLHTNLVITASIINEF